MAKPLEQWVEEDVRPYQGKPTRWLSENFFFRDPCRPAVSDHNVLLSPADGVILYQDFYHPGQPLLNLKGKHYDLRTALGKPQLDIPCAVVGIFLTFYDVHTNRAPYSGTLCYQFLDPLESRNSPMLDVEHSLLEDLKVPPLASFHATNQRVVNTIQPHRGPLRTPIYILQLADYDVDCILPFESDQHQPVNQGERFSQIRYGSQVDLVLPLYFPPTPAVEFVQSAGDHVEAGIDPLIRIV